LLAAIPVVFGLAACRGASDQKEAAGSPLAKLAAAEAARRVRVMNTVPHFSLTAQTGRPFGDRDLEGKVWIASFIFTQCRESCPLQTAEMAKLQKEFRGDPSLRDVQFVSITVDPDHDTPAALAEYASAAGADASSWHFLTGSRQDLWSLSATGFHLPVSQSAPGSGSLITHSQDFVLVDRGRRIRGLYDGLDEAARGRLREDLRLVLQDPPGPVTTQKDPKTPAPEGGAFHVPATIGNVAWMKERAEAQRKSLARFDVFHDFSFTDHLPGSGIDFVSEVVDDSGRDYKAVHYDHGSGVAIADVDGDGLQDIYFVTQLGANRLYRNHGGGAFEEIDGGGTIGLANLVGVTASFADIDNDGDPDLYVTTVKQGNHLYENDGKGRFTDISKGSGLDYTGHSSSAVFFDYDRDGLLDMFLCNVGVYTTDEKGPGGYYVGYPDAFSGHLRQGRDEQSYLFRNLGGNRFADVSRETGLVDMSWTGAASPLDLNEDGWIDLYVLSMQGHDEYYENFNGKRFVPKSREIFPRTPWGSMGIKVFDVDNDGRMDIYVTDMHTDMIDDAMQVNRAWYAEKMKMTETTPMRLLKTDGNHVLGNAFFHNDGPGRFREVSEEIGAESYWPWGLSTGDLNADGYQDVFIAASMNYPFRYGVNSLLLNNNGKEFLDSEFILGVEPRRDGRTNKHWFDLDCDGADTRHYLCQGLKGRYEVYGALGSRSSAIFDLDGDGDLDIVTNDFNSEPMILVSDLSEKVPGLRWLKVALAGTKSNRDGLGATVRVKAGGKEYVQVMDGMSGYLSQSSAPLYFGLGAAESVDGIEVSWPSGGKQSVAGPIGTNQALTVSEE
jgi:cytochrome oxidase Cu insertion factor (SCO1/SenC/PrrC family)